MSKDFLWALLKRFARIFVLGAVAQMLVIVQSEGMEVSCLEDLKVWGLALATGAFVGGLAAIEKALRYKKEADSGLANRPE